MAGRADAEKFSKKDVYKRQGDNSIVVKNILDRIITEFIRQNHDNTRNRILNSVSLIIGTVSYTHLVKIEEK